MNLSTQPINPVQYKMGLMLIDPLEPNAGDYQKLNLQKLLIKRLWQLATKSHEKLD